MYSIRPLIPLIALALVSPVWATGPAPAAVAPLQAGASHAGSSVSVNPYTGTEASVADLTKTLAVERLKTQIAEEKQRQKRAENEAKKSDRAEGIPSPGQFGTLKYPSEKMPDLGSMFFTPGGKNAKGMKGKHPPPSAAVAPAAPVMAPAPVVPAGPRLVGVIRDEGGRVAIIEQGGVLRQVKEGDSAHGHKVTKIGEGWAEVGGRRLTQDNSTLALVTNVDKQPVARVAAAGGASTAPAPVPVAQAMPFMPPGFQ